MSNIILGDQARINHGIRTKYKDSLKEEYKLYIDLLESDMITAVYDTKDNDCKILKTFSLIPDELGIREEIYKELEDVIINFCSVHNSSLTIQRNANSITILVDMKNTFNVSYTDGIVDISTL